MNERMSYVLDNRVSDARVCVSEDNAMDLELDRVLQKNSFLR